MPPGSPAPLPLSLSGHSAAAARARDAFAAAAASPAPALIVADAGLDAAAIARALHERCRPRQPFVVLDCAAADTDVEQALFGASPRTAANGEVESVGAKAALLRARGGTLYLKHLIELPAAAQRRLARVLRDRELLAGGRRVALRARIVADAPPSVLSGADDGQLRSDLLRRLSQMSIPVPTLRERPTDIPALAEAIAAEIGGGAAPAFTQAALTVLAAPAWPGNLDELRAVLDRVLRAGHAAAIRQEEVLAQLPIDGAFPRIVPQVSLREARRQFEREYIASVLERHRWRMSDAARTLGIERANLYRKTRQLGILRRTAAPAAS